MTKVHAVLVHGLGDDATAWDKVSSGLATDVQPHALTLPGFGGNTHEPVNIGEVVDHVCAIVEGLAQGDPVLLIGHSLGGVVATLAAERSHQSLVGLVNVEGNLGPEDCTFSRAAMEAKDFDGWFDDFSSGQTGRYGEAVRRCNRRAFLEMSKELVRVSTNADAVSRLERLPVPKLYCFGPTLSQVSQERLLCSDVSTTFFERSGHWIMDDQPEEFVEVVRRFSQTARA